MPVQSPTLGKRRLGAALKQLREDAGLSKEEVTKRLECSASKVSKIEAGDVSVSRSDLDALMTYYGVTDEAQRQDLLDLGKRARSRRGWWQKYSDLPSRYLEFIELEAAATSVRTFQPIILPGLLQTEAYARAVIESGPAKADLERRLKVRLERQSVLSHDDEPLQMIAILDESILYRQIGGRKVLREQLQHLMELVERPDMDVNIQVMPYDHGGHPGTTGGFTMLRFVDPLDPDVVYVDGFAGDVYLESAEDLQRCSLAFEELTVAGLSRPRSLKLIERACRDLSD